MTKKELRTLLADGKINRVLAELQRLTADDIDVHNEVLQISAQFAENDRQWRLNIAAPQDVRIEQNRINSVIITILDRLPDDSVRKMASPKWVIIALWFGIISAVAGFTVYTIKYFFDEKEKSQVERNKANSEKQADQSELDNPTKIIADSSKKNTKKGDKTSEKRPKPDANQTQLDEMGVKTTISQPRTSKAEDQQRPQQYNSAVKDENGNGIAGVEVYCPNCLIKKVRTDIEGNFNLEGHFEDGAAFWQSTVTFSKDKKIKTETINWREKSPQPIEF